MPSLAVLLVNLGSPDSTAVPDVRTYLREFLGDPRVIDRPKWEPARKFLVNQIITRPRAPKSAHAYEQIWTPEGSPLIVTSKKVREKLAQSLGAEIPVYLAMRYRVPSIESVVREIAAAGVKRVLLIPQYPHYAMSSWETVVVEVYAQAARHAPELRIECIAPFYQDADYIEALHQVSQPFFAQPHDHVLFSYHSIPERHLRVADSSQAHCTLVRDCCTTCSPAQATCYRAQVLATTRALVARAGIPANRHSISFQSRLAGEPWLVPYTDTELPRLAKSGIKRLVVLTPAFVADCLETLEEIAGEAAEIFRAAGGEHFQHVPCLNDQAPYIDFLANRARAWSRSAPPPVMTVPWAPVAAAKN